MIGQRGGWGRADAGHRGPRPQETGRPHFADKIGGLSFAPDGRRLAVMTFDDDLDTELDILTLDLLVDDPPNPVPPPKRIATNVGGVHWDGDRLLATRPTGPNSS